MELTVSVTTNSPLLNVRECAEYLKVSKSTIHRFIQDGFLPVVEIVKHKHLVPKDAVDAFIADRTGTWTREVH